MLPVTMRACVIGSFSGATKHAFDDWMMVCRPEPIARQKPVPAAAENA
jgi:hypothetical protein